MHIEDIARISLLLPVVFYFFRRAKNKILRVVFLFNILFLLHDFIYFFLRHYNKTAGSIFNWVFTPFEFFVIYLIFKEIFNLRSSKNILTYCLLFFVAFWLISSYFIPLNSFNSVLNAVESLIVIAFTLIYFYEEIKKPQHLFVYSQPDFWIVIGFFLFFTGSFFVFLYKQTHRHEDAFLDQYIYIHSAFFILRNLLFSVALFIKNENIFMQKENKILI